MSSPPIVDSSDQSLIGTLAEEYLQRLRAGESVHPQAYVEKYPDLADEIRDLFPALQMMEDVRPVADPESTTIRPRRSCISTLALNRIGDYQIVREIGRGGMGIVYEAMQESLGRRVALKVLMGNALKDSKHVQRFSREARAAARLHHTNIVPVFGVGEENGVHYYVMQYIEGQPLDQVLDELRKMGGDTDPSHCLIENPDSRPMNMALSLQTGHFSEREGIETTDALEDSSSSSSPPKGSSFQLASDTSLNTPSRGKYFQSVARIGIQVAEALEYASDQGVLHRDIKPSNLLLDTWGSVWVTDFGLAKATGQEDITHTGDVFGTLRYMAPERFRGSSDIRSDIYALGLTLYEMLSLQPAYDFLDRAQLMHKILNSPMRSLKSLDPGIPTDLVTIVHKSLSKDPSDRYSSPRFLAEDLRAFIQDRPIAARRSTVLESGVRWCKRNPIVASLTSLIAVLLMALTIVAVIYAGKLEVERNVAMLEMKKTSEAMERYGAERQRAMQAEYDGRVRLWESRLAQAQASRWSGRPGQRLTTLEALKDASKVLHSLQLPNQAQHVRELRNEAIAAMSLIDINRHTQWAGDRSAVAFDGNFRITAFSNEKGDVHLQRLSDFQTLGILKNQGKGGHAYILKFSPNGEYLVAYHHKEWNVRIWNVKTMQETADYPAMGFDFGPDNVSLAFGDREKNIQIFDLRAGRIRKTIPCKGTINHLSYHPGGTQLFVHSEQGRFSEIIDIESEKMIQPIMLNLSPIPQPLSTAWRGDGRALAAILPTNQAVIWNLDTRSTVVMEQRFPVVHGVSVSFSPDGRLLVTSGADEQVRVWNAFTGKLLLSAPGACQLMQFSPDGQLLAAEYDSSKTGLWKMTYSQEYSTLHNVEEQDLLWQMSFRPDGKWLATPHQDGVRVWDTVTKKLLAHLNVGPIDSVFFVKRGLLACGQQGLFLWSIQETESEYEFGEPENIGLAATRNEHRRCTPLNDKTLLIHERLGKNILLLDMETKQTRILAENTPPLDQIAVSPDGRWMVLMPYELQFFPVQLWDVETGKMVRELDHTEKGRAAFSPDGRWLVTGSAREYKIWEVESWKVHKQIARDRTSYSAGEMCFNRDGTVLAICSSRNSLQLLEVGTFSELATLEIPTTGRVDWPIFSPDGNWLAAGAERAGIQLWNLKAIRANLKEADLDWSKP